MLAEKGDWPIVYGAAAIVLSRFARGRKGASTKRCLYACDGVLARHVAVVQSERVAHTLECNGVLHGETAALHISCHVKARHDVLVLVAYVAFLVGNETAYADKHIALTARGSVKGRFLDREQARGDFAEILVLPSVSQFVVALNGGLGVFDVQALFGAQVEQLVNRVGFVQHAGFDCQIDVRLRNVVGRRGGGHAAACGVSIW